MAAYVGTPQAITMEDIDVLAERISTVLERTQSDLLAPTGVKEPPRFPAARVADMCGLTPTAFARILERKDPGDGMPTGEAQPNRMRLFSAEDAQKWVRKYRKCFLRPEGSPAAIIGVGNFKGGVGKTVITACLAQGLTMKGHRVLCIDYDPQGSLTTMLGLSPALISAEETVMPIMYRRDDERASDSLKHVVRNTYWPNLDIVPSSFQLFAGEFELPLRQMLSNTKGSIEPDFMFNEVLINALQKDLLYEYDFILIDTPPALSYMTLTAFWASDGLLMPIPADGIDFASSAQFWSMLTEISGTFQKKSGRGKEFAFILAVPSKINSQIMTTRSMLAMMKRAYGAYYANTEIPDTAAVRVQGTMYMTVYDGKEYLGSRKTLQRATDAFDKLVAEVEDNAVQRIWRSGALDGGSASRTSEISAESV